MVTGAAHRLRGGTAGRLPPPAQWYVAGVATLAILVLTRAVVGDADWDADIPWSVALLVLALLFLVCDSTPTNLTSRQSAWSPSSSATLAAVVLLGPAGAVLVGATSLLSVRRGLQFTQRI